jgi:hypothetical protein
MGKVPDEVKDMMEIPVPDVSETDKLLLEKGFTAEELMDLGDEEKAGLLMGDEDDEPVEDEPQVSAEELAKIAAEAPVVESPALAVEEPVFESPAVLSDEDLLKYRPVVTAAELTAIADVPEELDAKLTALDAKYDAGDLTMAQYNRERDKVNREIWDVQNTAKETQREAVSWQKTQGQFFRNRPEYLIVEGATPEEAERREIMYGAFRQKADALTAKQAETGMSDMEILVAADKAVKRIFNIKPAEAAPVVAPEKKPPAKLPDIVTLGDLPAAAPTSLDSDPFAALDKLTGEAYEAALERLTDQQRRIYEDGASKPSRRTV